MIAIASALAFLVLLFAGILLKGIPGMFQHYVTIDVILDKERLDPSGEMTRESLSLGDFDGVIKDSVYDTLGGVTGRKAKRAARKIVSSGASQRLTNYVLNNPSSLGQVIPLKFAVDDDIDTFLRGMIDRQLPESDRRVSDRVIRYVDQLNEEGRISFELSDYLFFGSGGK